MIGTSGGLSMAGEMQSEEVNEARGVSAFNARFPVLILS